MRSPKLIHLFCACMDSRSSFKSPRRPGLYIQVSLLFSPVCDPTQPDLSSLYSRFLLQLRFELISSSPSRKRSLASFQKRAAAAVAIVVSSLLLVAGVVAAGGPPPSSPAKSQKTPPVTHARKMLINSTAAANTAAEKTAAAAPSDCSEDSVVVSQDEEGPRRLAGGLGGIPSYSVSITNTCLSCTVRDVHVSCAEFASEELVDPSDFRRVAVGDCLVKDGGAMGPGDTVTFDYSNLFMYQLSVASVSCSCS